MVIIPYILVPDFYLAHCLTCFLKGEGIPDPARISALIVGSVCLLGLHPDFDYTVGVHLAKELSVVGQLGRKRRDYKGSCCDHLRLLKIF